MKSIQIIENCSELGAGTRGASLGIDAIKLASLKFQNNLFRELPCLRLTTENELLYQPSKFTWAKRIDGVTAVFERISDALKNCVRQNQFPLVLAGDHSSAAATIAGLKLAKPNERLGVIWIDAHADLHSPYTSPSGNIHGMPLAISIADSNTESAVSGRKLKADVDAYWEGLLDFGGISPKINTDDLKFVAVRDTEKQEDHLIEKHNIKNYTRSEINTLGITQLANDLLASLQDCDAIYISFDVDSMDCDWVSRGTGTPVSNGLRKEEVKLLLGLLVQDPKVNCLEIVEVNPLLDDKVNMMAETTFEILEHAVVQLQSRL